MNKDLMTGLAWGGGMIALALAATLARKLGMIDQDMVLRIVIGANGLMVAWYGNRAPKQVAPSQHAARIARVAGWSLALSGLVYAGLWAFAPIPEAIALGCAALILGMIVTFAYCYWLRLQARSEARPQP